MSDDHEDSLRQERWGREARRRRRIERFAAYQRNVRHNWVCLADIVEWCASIAPVRTIEAQEEARALTSNRLFDSANSGEFDRGAKCKLLYLVPDVYIDRGPEGALLISFPRVRMTREGLEQAASAAGQFDAHFGLPSSPPPLLRSVWVPSDLARQWLAARGHPWPAHFGPIDPAAARTALPAPTSGGEIPDHPGALAPQPPHRGLRGEVVDRANASDTPAGTRPSKTRGAYFGDLEAFILRTISRFKPEVFALMSDDAIALQFADYCKGLKSTGKPAPSLPRDRRNVVNQVTKIRERLAVTRSKPAASNTA